MKNWSGKVALVLAIVALLFTILGNPVVQERVSTFTPTSLVGREIKDILTVGMSNVAYAAAPDYECDGADDNVQVQEALNALPTGGKIILFAGNYNFGATVSRTINNVTFEGSGKGTSLAYNGSTALISAGSQTGWVFRDIATDAGWFTLASDTIVDTCWNAGTLAYVGGDSHSNRSTLDATTASFTTALKTSYDWLVTNITSTWKTTVDDFIASKGVASGLASLNASSLVVQEPASKAQASGVASLNASSLVVQNPANASATAGASKIPIADANGKLVSGWGGNASTIATLDGSSLVVQNPANATATATASKIPISDADTFIGQTWLGSGTASSSTYLRGDQTWATPAGGSPDPVTTIDISEEFIAGLLTTGNIGDLGWCFTGTAPTYIASVANHPGIRQLPTTTTSASITALWLGSAVTNDVIQFGDLCDFTFIIRMTDVTSNTAFVGAMDAMATAVGNQDRYGFEYIDSSDTYWMMVTGTGSASTRTATDITVTANTWYKMRVVRTATGVDYYIDGVNKGSVTTTLPDTALNFGFHVQTNTTAAKYLQCDFFRMTLTGVTR